MVDRVSRWHSLRGSKRPLAGIALLIGSVLLVVLAAALAVVSANQLRSSVGWVRHTSIVLEEIARSREAILDASLALRNWVISGDSYYVAQNDRARSRLTRHLDSLSTLVVDNADQFHRVAALKTTVMARSILLHRDGGLSETRRSMIANGLRGKGALANFRKAAASFNLAFERLRGAEIMLLQRRTRGANSAAAMLIGLSGLVVLFAMISTGLGIYLLQRERNDLHLRELQSDLMHSQRLSLMNQASAVLAHELSQPLTAARNYLSALRRQASHYTPENLNAVATTADKAGTQIQRAGEIVKRLRDFTEKTVGEKRYEAAGTLIADAVAMLSLLSREIALQTDADEIVPPLLVDRIQIQQVLVNLMRNALEAMHDTEQPALILTIRRNGDAAEFIVEDNGPGISKETAARLFQPFTSSKREGMGVGLSICHTIITAHGGQIWAEARNHHGAAFHFTLPIPEDKAAAA
jgi:C4-dicarboxylate-specific signal transduction histidine kinase